MKKLLLSLVVFAAAFNPMQVMAEHVISKIVLKQDADLLLTVIYKNDCEVVKIESLDQDKDGYVLIVYK